MSIKFTNYKLSCWKKIQYQDNGKKFCWSKHFFFYILFTSFSIFHTVQSCKIAFPFSVILCSIWKESIDVQSLIFWILSSIVQDKNNRIKMNSSLKFFFFCLLAILHFCLTEIIKLFPILAQFFVSGIEREIIQ